MTTPGPLDRNAFVQAEGTLAEFLCRVHLVDLTPERARELRRIHQGHRPDDCLVYLEASYLLMVYDGE